MQQVEPTDADMVWLLYDLVLDPTQNRYQLTRHQVVYTRFEPALQIITTPQPGPIEDFVQLLQEKLDEKLENGHPPDAPALTDVLGL